MKPYGLRPRSCSYDTGEPCVSKATARQQDAAIEREETAAYDTHFYDHLDEMDECHCGVRLHMVNGAIAWLESYRCEDCIADGKGIDRESEPLTVPLLRAGED